MSGSRKVFRPPLAVSLTAVLSIGLGMFPSNAVADGRTCGIEGQITDRGAGWKTIRLPEFDRHPLYTEDDESTFGVEPPSYHPTYSAAVDPVVPQRMFVTDSFTVKRSEDGGCTWSDVFALPDAPPADSPLLSRYTANIRGITIPEAPGAHNTVYLAIEAYAASDIWTPTLRLLSHALVYRSEDGGQTWKDWSQGLPPQPTYGSRFPGGYHGNLQVAQSDPDIAYLKLGDSVQGNADLDALLFRKKGSEPWVQVSEAIGDPSSIDAELASNYTHLYRYLIDPIDPNTLWRWQLTVGGDGRGDKPAERSVDGGRTWVRPVLDFNAGGVAVRHQSGRPAEVFMVPNFNDYNNYGGLPSMLKSDDGGDTFTRVPLLANSCSLHSSTWLVMGTRPGFAAGQFTCFLNGSGIQGLFRLDARIGRWISITLPWTPVRFEPIGVVRSRRSALYFLGQNACETARCDFYIAAFSGVF